MLRGAAAGVAGLVTAGAAAGCTAQSEQPTTGASAGARSPRVLLAYFSRAGENYYDGGRRDLTVGNTEVIAQHIRARIGCDVFRIEAADPYSDDYDATVQRNQREQQTDSRPRIQKALPDLGRYDTVLIGSGIWNVRPPMIMSTFAEGLDFTGKTVLPFVTYAVSRLGNAMDVYRATCRGARFGDPLAVRGEEAVGARTRVETWLHASGLTGR